MTTQPAPPCQCGHPRHAHVRLSGIWAHCTWWNSAGRDGFPCRYCGRYTPTAGLTMHQWDTPNGRRWRVDCDHCDWESGAHPIPDRAARLGREHLADTHEPA